ncbi:TetR/AcrR family transcriptional regulator [Rhizobium sp. RAF56]|jgi:AcrR family transcriptional regulator|uniref:TetR/AcrR family transcriptional regulator n=1 Tax=Rhizobium sp. RAF56 TaxID=3233062 RepID=UPI003F9D26FC
MHREAQVLSRPRGRPKTVSDEQRRAQIMAEARTTFHELGYGGTTMDLVAARCKLSKQTLYKLFPSKADLFMAIIDAHRATMLRLPRDPDEHLPLAQTLEDIFMLDIGEEEERDREALIHLFVRESQAVPEIGILLTTHAIQQSRQLLADWLELQKAQGRIELADTSGGARMLMNMIFGAMTSLPGCPSDWPDREARNRHLRQCIEIFLAGVRRPSHPISALA